MRLQRPRPETKFLEQVIVMTFHRVSALFTLVVSLTLAVALFQTVLAQTTISTGSIVGIATDPSGAVVTNAKVSIKNEATSQVIDVATNSSGAYNSGALVPGQYTVRFAAPGFRSVVTNVTVQVGNTATANVKFQVGQADQVIDVQGVEVQVNTEQAIVQGVLSATQIETLPVNGR